MRTLSTLALTLCCVALYGAETKNIDKTLSLRATGNVRLEAHNGTVHVHTWDKPEIEIHVRIEAGGTSSEDVRRFNETSVDINGSGDSVTIKTKSPESSGFSWNWFGNSGNSPQVHYNITAPKTASWNIEDHNSKAEIRDLHAALHMTTHNGELRVANLDGPLDLTMHNGTARVEFASFQHASSVDFHNGDVELTLPAASKFNLETDSHNMHIKSDFAVMTHTSGSRYRQQNLNGPVNGGGPVLHVASHNGQLAIHSR